MEEEGRTGQSQQFGNLTTIAGFGDGERGTRKGTLWPLESGKGQEKSFSPPEGEAGRPADTLMGDGLRRPVSDFGTTELYDKPVWLQASVLVAVRSSSHRKVAQ